MLGLEAYLAKQAGKAALVSTASALITTKPGRAILKAAAVAGAKQAGEQASIAFNEAKERVQPTIDQAKVKVAAGARQAQKMAGSALVTLAAKIESRKTTPKA